MMVLAKRAPGEARPEEDPDLAVRQIVSRAVGHLHGPVWEPLRQIVPEPRARGTLEMGAADSRNAAQQNRTANPPAGSSILRF